MKRFLDDVTESVSHVRSGMTVLIGGFGMAGHPVELIEALLDHDVRDLTVVSNNAGNADEGLAVLIKQGKVRRILCSFPRQSDSYHFDTAYRAGKIELEVVPQGTLAERIRAGGAGLGGFYTRTGYGTLLAEGKESRIIDGQGYVLERPIVADVALVKAHRADRAGNLTYRKTARNFNPIMASAARHTIAQVHEVVPAGDLDPEVIITPGIFTHTIVTVPQGQPADPAATDPDARD